MTDVAVLAAELNSIQQPRGFERASVITSPPVLGSDRFAGRNSTALEPRLR